MKRKEKGFTLVEAVMVFAVIGMLAILSTIVVMKTSPEVYKLRTKQTYLVMKRALAELISNPLYYYPEGNLADITASKTDDKNYSGSTKFRNLMITEMEINRNSHLRCEILTSTGPLTIDECYQTENGVVFGIPNTDFAHENMVRQKNAQGNVSDYVPITIYPDGSKARASETNTMNSYAIFLGVRIDGATTVVNTVDCEDDDNKNSLQCKAPDYIATLNIDFE